jgi:hypothetical protein
MEATPARGFRFDGFSVDLVRRQLVGADRQPIALTSRAYDVLV